MHSFARLAMKDVGREKAPLPNALSKGGGRGRQATFFSGVGGATVLGKMAT